VDQWKKSTDFYIFHRNFHPQNLRNVSTESVDVSAESAGTTDSVHTEFN